MKETRWDWMIEMKWDDGDEMRWDGMKEMRWDDGDEMKELGR